VFWHRNRCFLITGVFCLRKKLLPMLRMLFEILEKRVRRLRRFPLTQQIYETIPPLRRRAWLAFALCIVRLSGLRRNMFLLA
jgi:hypothetical protein